MNVWTIVMSQRLEDADNTRSMLISRFLMERGHSVTMWTSAFDHIRKCWRHAGRESYRDPSGLHVRFMFGGGYARNISPQRYIDHLRAAKDFRRRARGLPKPDLILANIPDHFTAYSAWRYAQEHRIPFVVDVRDK
ncbi:MAG TPA: hypothetical protein VFL96_03965, partial [Acidobacteriaceae bacterium]|nr:hypothetical protein [Acidobacteriaceae bacterium]